MTLPPFGNRSKLLSPLMKRCAAKTRKGKPCKNQAMWGSDMCGPHTDQRSSEVTTFRVVKAGLAEDR